MHSGFEHLVGSWAVDVTTPKQGDFPALLTFIEGGGLVAAESPAPFESGGHGSWANRGPGEIAYTFVGLMGSAEGKNTGRLKVVGTLHQKPDQSGWDGPFKIEVKDADQKVTFTDRGTVHLTRIAVETLD